MKLIEIKNKIPEKLYDCLKFEELRPPQALAVEAGLLEGKNLVVASPTASGKTLVAEIACVKNVIEHGGKAIYLTPLKALAHEKYSELKEKYHFLKTMLSVGDFDSNDPWLEKADIIVCSNEKLDSLIRHSVPWLSQINTIIIDEIHVLDQTDRGPTLEVLITRLKTFCKKAQIIALSATIKNSIELSKWLEAELVKSNYRPVQLEYGIFTEGKLWFEKKKKEEIPKAESPEHCIILDTLAKKKQILVFLSSRKNAEAVAKNSQLIVSSKLTAEEKKKLAKISEEIRNALEIPTKQCEILADCVKHGTAFHHAGLVQKQHRLIEDSFKSGELKLISATPTLAYGCNLPSHTVLVRDLKRYSGGYGSNWIPVLEVQQMFGRAGRPQFDREGRALMISKNETEREDIYERYVKGEPEEIYSKLSAEPVLRMQMLGLIASSEITSRETMLEFFSKTFFAFQYQNIEQIKIKLENALTQLIEYDFVSVSGTKISATNLGKRVAELYIDPDSANLLLEKIAEKNKNNIFWLHAICSCSEMRPLLRILSKEFKELQQTYLELENELPQPNPWEISYDKWLNAFKTSLLLKDWIEENSEQILMDKYNEAPGNLRNRLFLADWLLYSAGELARIKNAKEILLPLRKLRIRVKNGAKEELINLLQLEGIGRVRARKLFNSGIKKVGEVKSASSEKLTALLGKKTAEKIKSQTNLTKETTLESF